jgi:hypothetical protein
MRPPALPAVHALALTALFIAGVSAVSAQSPVTTSLNGQTFVNHGLVGVGRLPANQKDKFGETFGSFSAFMFQPGSWQRNTHGSYSGTLLAQPDRGYNAAGTTNYVARYNKLAVTFTSAPAGATSQTQVGLTLSDTVPCAKPKPLLVRAAGPALTGFGVTGALLDPTLAIFDRQGRQIATNDNWSANFTDSAAIRAAALRVGAFAFADGSRDAAAIVELDPGSYTVQVSGIGVPAGISLIEVYELP